MLKVNRPRYCPGNPTHVNVIDFKKTNYNIKLLLEKADNSFRKKDSFLEFFTFNIGLTTQE